MDVMLRILKNNVSGRFVDDIVNVYDVEDLTNYQSNETDWFVIIRNFPSISLNDVKKFFNGGIKDVSGDPDDPIITTRLCQYSINWSVIPKDKKVADLKGWIDIDYFPNLIVDHR